VLNETDKLLFVQSIDSLKVGELVKMPLTLTREDGRLIAIDMAISGALDNGVKVAVVVISERSEKERMIRLLDRLAFYDTLTELPNRLLLFDRINQALSLFKREASGFALAILDLDGFKQVNDLHGHATGDFLLKDVAHRLSHCVRNVDTVARLGGDEFALILHGVTNEDEAQTVLGKIILEVAKPVNIGVTEITVTASMGISFCPRDGASINELLGRADFAMYLAKHSGGSCYRISTGDVSSSSERLQMEPLIDFIKLGFDVIDEQHEDISMCIRGMLRALASGEEADGLKRRAEYLQQLTNEHFRTEEDLMRRFSVSGLDEHRLEHDILMRQLQDFMPNPDGYGVTIMSHTFKDWLVPHIQTKDRDLVDQLRAAGINGH
jgi:diguanylate cyclase (GGDEF)-like protein/hemerythrin-like metal-binding protein